MSLSDYYTANDAARVLKVHPETVKRLCRQGDLPADKLHNTWLIRKDVLDVFSGTYNSRPGARRRLL
jgi:excisionase family DNA binding protein